MIFDIDYINYVWYLLTPPALRQPKQLAWGTAVMAGKQWKGQAFFEGYMQGAAYLTPPLLPATDAYDPSAFYTTGDRIIYLLQAGGAYYGDNAVYEAININPDGSNNAPFTGLANAPVTPAANNIVPSNPPASALASTSAALQWLSGYKWIQVQPNFIGANERASYNCQKKIYEYALNKWFNTTWKQPAAGQPDIYITNNTINSLQFYFSQVTKNSFWARSTDLTYSKFFRGANSFVQQYCFSINIPVADYNALIDTGIEAPVAAGGNSPLRDGVVCSFADTLCPVGAIYNIITY